MAERTHLTIGEVLTLLREEFPDVSISKIRFLESQGLVDPERTPSGYRKFYDHDVERLRWILQQQREHFLPLKVIRGRLNEQRQQGADGRDEPSPAGGAAATAGHNGNGSGAGAHPGAPGDAGGPATVVRPEPTAGAAPATRNPGAGAGGAPATPGGPPRVTAGAASADSPPADSPPADSPSAGAPPAEGGPTATPPATQPGTTGTAAPGGAGEAGSSAAGERASSGSRPEPARAATEGPNPVAARAASPATAASLGPPPAPAPSAVVPPASTKAAPAAADRTTTPGPGAGRTPAPSGPGQPDVYTADELAAAAGCEPELVADLQQFGLLTANATVRGVAYFDPEALTVARTAARFAAVGVEPRHLRAWKTAADREVSLFEQLVMPLLRQRNPQSRKQAAELLERLADLGADLRAELVREGIARIR